MKQELTLLKQIQFRGELIAENYWQHFKISQDIQGQFQLNVAQSFFG